MHLSRISTDTSASSMAKNTVPLWRSRIDLGESQCYTEDASFTTARDLKLSSLSSTRKMAIRLIWDEDKPSSILGYSTGPMM